MLSVSREGGGKYVNLKKRSHFRSCSSPPRIEAGYDVLGVLRGSSIDK